jgi:hypothetical protein
MDKQPVQVKPQVAVMPGFELEMAAPGDQQLQKVGLDGVIIAAHSPDTISL